jgi:LPXTG-motif cell wall-anchored protein
MFAMGQWVENNFVAIMVIGVVLLLALVGLLIFLRNQNPD